VSLYYHCRKPPLLPPVSNPNPIRRLRHNAKTLPKKHFWNIFFSFFFIVFRYAIKSVLLQLRSSRRTVHWDDMGRRRLDKLVYVELWKRKLVGGSAPGIDSEGGSRYRHRSRDALTTCITHTLCTLTLTLTLTLILILTLTLTLPPTPPTPLAAAATVIGRMRLPAKATAMMTAR